MPRVSLGARIALVYYSAVGRIAFFFFEKHEFVPCVSSYEIGQCVASIIALALQLHCKINCDRLFYSFCVNSKHIWDT
jgi:hypothetical protein